MPSLLLRSARQPDPGAREFLEFIRAMAESGALVEITRWLTPWSRVFLAMALGIPRSRVKTHSIAFYFRGCWYLAPGYFWEGLDMKILNELTRPRNILFCLEFAVIYGRAFPERDFFYGEPVKPYILSARKTKYGMGRELDQRQVQAQAQAQPPNAPARMVVRDTITIPTGQFILSIVLARQLEKAGGSPATRRDIIYELAADMLTGSISPATLAELASQDLDFIMVHAIAALVEGDFLLPGSPDKENLLCAISSLREEENLAPLDEESLILEVLSNNVRRDAPCIAGWLEKYPEALTAKVQDNLDEQVKFHLFQAGLLKHPWSVCGSGMRAKVLRICASRGIKPWSSYSDPPEGILICMANIRMPTVYEIDAYTPSLIKLGYSCKKLFAMIDKTPQNCRRLVGLLRRSGIEISTETAENFCWHAGIWLGTRQFGIPQIIQGYTSWVVLSREAFAARNLEYFAWLLSIWRAAPRIATRREASSLFARVIMSGDMRFIQACEFAGLNWLAARDRIRISNQCPDDRLARIYGREEPAGSAF